MRRLSIIVWLLQAWARASRHPRLPQRTRHFGKGEWGKRNAGEFRDDGRSAFSPDSNWARGDDGAATGLAGAIG